LVLVLVLGVGVRVGVGVGVKVRVRVRGRVRGRVRVRVRVRGLHAGTAYIVEYASATVKGINGCQQLFQPTTNAKCDWGMLWRHISRAEGADVSEKKRAPTRHCAKISAYRSACAANAPSEERFAYIGSVGGTFRVKCDQSKMGVGWAE
jgi:hypothetical protein